MIDRLRALASLPHVDQERIASRVQAKLDEVAPFAPLNDKRAAGLGEGSIEMAEDFDEPVPVAFWLGKA